MAVIHEDRNPLTAAIVSLSAVGGGLAAYVA